MSADNIKLKFVSPLTSGCTNPEAANYDASMNEDDGSCLFVGGRGVTSASWSAMSGPHKLDDWYPKQEYETWATEEFCQIPEGAQSDDLESCWQGNCFLHRQCGTGSFCCVTDSHEGCTARATVDNEEVDEEGWKLLFRHDKAKAGPWPKGTWGTNHSSPFDPEKNMFSQLGQLEKYRRPSDGRFELKMCWPESGFEKCQHWVQLKNPMLNPDSTNTHAMCVDCPYAPDTDQDGNEEFRGLQYAGTDYLLDGDSDGSYMQLGVANPPYEHHDGYWHYRDTEGFYGPVRKNDAGQLEFPHIVELYVRPDISGDSCISCKACYDEDGAVRMATFYPNASAPYSAPACPEFCLTEEHVSPKPRAATLRATHQLVVASKGLSEQPCEVVVSYDAIESSEVNTTICEGMYAKNTDSVPSSQEFGRLGGVHTKAFFVVSLFI